MPTKSEPDLVQSLEEVLDLERSALIEGDLDRLNHMVPAKEKLIGAINELDVFESEDLIRVQKKVERNQALLNSAADGIRAVAARMAELRRVRQEFSTYGADGQRNGFAVRSHPKLEKRA
ncbi:MULTISPECIES: flagellar export chaperone FlgN [unclassified Ruegeria]|uniref:flagellar export chaperone FlgN n=1 Tax=unclassified Ruegeria TaxID=2625375 RepID=UPI001ADAB3E6|nr:MULTISPECIES: flagellar export chaperone FlgN [unclassified Ruegeria]MBO9413133.1 flagellar export chaperone FlgN [Ruegeria sp. R8_1]MBO9416883.1 flagellar export chaperone FlgN [Ruegeria sp. R8_2]